MDPVLHPGVRLLPDDFGPSPIGLGRQRDIPRPPSEYIYRQVYGAFIQDTVGCKLLPEYGAETFMWSND